MSDDNRPFVMYMCFEADHDEELCRSLAIRSTKSQVEQWKQDRRNAEESGADSGPDDEELNTDSDVEKSTDYPQDPSIDLSNLMTRFQETMSSYRPLVQFSIAFTPTLRWRYIYNDIYKSARRNLEIADHDEQFITYGINEDQYMSVNTQLRRLREFDRGATVLPGAILLSLVATFDSFIADTIRLMLKHKPERLIGSSKTISVGEVLKMSSFEDVIGKITEDEVEALMRGSHDEQIKYIEDNLNVTIRPHYDRWGELMETFERGNLVAHGNTTVNLRYIRNCNKHGGEINEDRIGEKLPLDGQYLRRSSGLLLEFGLSLMFVLWLKHFENTKEKAYGSLTQRTYELIKDGQARVAARLLDLALFKQKPDASDRTIKMMTVNLANAYKKSKNNERAQEVIGAVDWSATTDDFQICIAALQGDIERFVDLMPVVAQVNSITKSDFREWPVFDWIRDEKVVREKFQEIYGEPIIEPEEEEEEKDGQDNTSTTQRAATPTLH